MKRALITGITGQDGSYLAELLAQKGYVVYGLVRRTSTNPLMRIEDLCLSKKVKLIDGNLRDIGSLARALKESQPDEIYNLAAQSDVGVSFKCPEETMEINYYGLGRLVNEVLKFNPKIKIYQASTSEMFGNSKPHWNEKSSFSPVSPYGESKFKAHQDYVLGYREKHGLFIVSGILFNHESPRRGKNFVTRKITTSMAKIKLGLQSELELGNLYAKRDWGFAGDYVVAMWQMLQAKKPDDFVIATGESHTVKEFLDATAKVLDMDLSWSGKGLKEVGKSRGKVIVRINKDYYRPAEIHYLLGNSAKAKKILKWQPKTSFAELVEMMALADYNLLKCKS